MNNIATFMVSSYPHYSSKEGQYVIWVLLQILGKSRKSYIISLLFLKHQTVSENTDVYDSESGKMLYSTVQIPLFQYCGLMLQSSVLFSSIHFANFDVFWAHLIADLHLPLALRKRPDPSSTRDEYMFSNL